MLGAVMFGHRHFQPVIDAIIQLAEKAAKEPREFAMPDTSAIEKEMLGIVEADLRKAYSIPKQGRAPGRRRRGQEEGDGALLPGRHRQSRAADAAWSPACSRTSKPRSSAGTSSTPRKRIDGRDLVTVRPIVCEAPFLPRTHGSALFTRGETQAIVVATLGTSEDEQFIDALQGTYKEAFLLHYNFPPFSVGETGRIGAPGPPRDRPRQAGLARDPSDPAVEGGVPLHHPRGVGDHRVQRLVVDGDGVRHLARADGRRRSAQARRSPASPWA